MDLFISVPQSYMSSGQVLHFQDSYISVGDSVVGMERGNKNPESQCEIFQEKRHLRPSNVKPLHCDLGLGPHLGSRRYEGIVAIDLSVKENITSTLFHMRDLDIERSVIVEDGKKLVSNPPLTYNKQAQIATVSFSRTIPADSSIQLQLTFEGRLNDQSVGFYYWPGEIHSIDPNATYRCEKGFPVFR